MVYMSLVTRKPVFGVCDQVRLKPACRATEARQRLEIANIETRDIILSRQRTTTAEADLRHCCSHLVKTGFLMTWLICLRCIQHCDRLLLVGHLYVYILTMHVVGSRTFCLWCWKRPTRSLIVVLPGDFL